MNKFDVNSAKFLSIIIAICFIFIMVVWHAFDYLPTKEENNNTLYTQTNNKISEVVSRESTTVENSDKTEQATEENEVETTSEKVIKESSTNEDKKLEPLETIYEGTPLSNESKLSQEESNISDANYDRAKDYMTSKRFVEAITEYKKIIQTTDDDKLKAQCYEDISIAYAVLKRYGSALSAAQRAYNLAPSSHREVLLARLYYKTGDIDKATSRVNNVLRRDFSINDK